MFGQRFVTSVCTSYLLADGRDVQINVCDVGNIISFSRAVHLGINGAANLADFNAVKRIIKYVGGTCDYELFYSKESNLSLVGFSDSDWAGNAMIEKAPLVGVFM